MSQYPDQPDPFDPFSAWRGMRDNYMDAWSKAMIQTVNSDAYAQAVGTLLDSYLTVSAPFREVLEKTMTQVLTQLNMPTRSDVTNLAERLTNIEMRLDDLDAKLDAMQRDTERSTASSGERSSRAKKEE
jgi:polyhydroxyalkanoic acid synthase PhaR subunit